MDRNVGGGARGGGRESESANRILEVGESFGNYRVVRCLSAGLMVNYYQMEHVRDKTNVTIGVLHPRTQGHEKVVNRLRNLQQALSALDHEGVVHIRDIVEFDGRHCLFMDAVEGVGLSEYVRTRRVENQEVDGEFVIQVLADLLGVLGCAHAQGMDHRDLSTDSIFVTESGRVVLLGLGLKAALGVDVFESIVSAAVSPLHAHQRMDSLSSFDVMSPEYRSGIEEDARVDVYAAAFVGYWMLTGTKAKVVDLTPPSAVVDGLSSEWDVFFAKALQRNREDRMSSCRAALMDLQELGAVEGPADVSFVERQLNRIPVPARVVERGGDAARVYRLSVIGLVGVTLIALMATYLDHLFTEESSGGGAGAVVEAVQVELVKDATLTLRVAPKTARVRIKGQSMLYRPRNGQLLLDLRPGAYQLEVLATNYTTQQLDAVVVANGDLLSLEASLEPLKNYLVVLSEPGAEVRLLEDGQEPVVLGLTDEAGRFEVDASEYRKVYTLVVSKEGFFSEEADAVEFERGQTAEFELPLASTRRELQVVSQPVGAEVYIDGDLLGFTPFDFDQAEVGAEYALSVELEGYRTQSRQVVVGRDSPEVLVEDFGALEYELGTLRYRVEFAGVSAAGQAELLDELVLRINGTVMDVQADGVERLRQGLYELELEHPSYLLAPQRVEIFDAKETSLDLQMLPKPGRLELKVSSDVVAELRADGLPVQLRSGQVELPAQKLIELELRVRNYMTLRRRLTLEPNGVLVWEPKLIPIPGPELRGAWRVPYVGLAMTWLRPGRFVQGSPTSERFRLPNEGPQTQVELTYGFWMGVYEVTQAQYRSVMGMQPAEFDGAQRPVESIRWEQARLFCERLTAHERAQGRLPSGFVYRLPSEVEWEYAARAGSQDVYTFGGSVRDDSGNFRLGLGRAAPLGTQVVGSFEPNAWGLYDMSGNVAEWMLDAYDGRLAGAPQVDPRPRAWRPGERVVVRGGSWRDGADQVRVSVRKDVNPANYSNEIGFRVVLAPAVD